MLGAANRLRDRADFNTVRERGRRWRGDLLILNAMQHEPNGEPDGASRFGFVVSRRVGKAVVRNRVKRRFRAIIRRHLNAIVRGYDIVLIARPGAGEASFTALAGAALALLRQARLATDLPEVS